MLLSVLLASLLWAPAQAQDALGLAPGTPVGDGLDAPTTSDARGPVPGVVVLGGLLGQSHSPVSVCGQPRGQTVDCKGPQGNPWVQHSTALVVSGAQGLAGGWSWGGALRARLLSIQPDPPAGWSVADGGSNLPWTLQGANRPAVEDLSLFVQKHVLTRASRHHLAARLQANLDRELFPGLWGGPAPLPSGGAAPANGSHVAWLYGSGTGATAGAVYTYEAPERDGDAAPWLRGSIEVSGTLRSTARNRCGPLPCSTGDNGADGVQGAPLPTGASPQVRGGLALRVLGRDDLAALAEARLGTDLVGHLASEVRGGLRWRTAGPSGLDVMGLVGLSPTLGIGDPGLSAVIGLRWIPEELEPQADPRSPSSEAVFVVRSAAGDPLPLRLGGDLEGVAAHLTPEGEAAVVLPGVRPLRVRLGAPGHATWTETLDLTGPGPFRIERVLPPATGEGVVSLSVIDEEGRPVPQAVLQLDGLDLGGVCGTCDVQVSGLAEGSHEVVVSRGAVDPVSQRVEAVGAEVEAAELLPVFLQRPFGSVTVSVQDAAGPRPDARVTLVQAMGVEALPLDREGKADLVLPPGRYRVRVTAAGMGAQERSLLVDERDSRLHTVSILLLPAAEDGATLDVGLLTAEGRPLGGAAVRLGATLLGETATGGGLRVEDLPAGSSVLSLSHPDFRAYPSQSVSLAEGEELAVLAPLAWKAGSFALRVEDAQAAPVDARVELRQPGAVTTVRRTGPDGRLTIRLPVGDWDVVVSAPGRTTTTLRVAGDPERVFVARGRVVLHPLEADTGVVSVAVSDKADQPVEGARIVVDGKAVGSTSTGGTLLVEGMDGSAVPLRVEGELYDPWTGRSQVQSGVQSPTEVRLKERLGLVTLRARTAEGDPVDAFVRLLGPVSTVPRRLGPTGEQRYRLPEGFWEVLFSHEAYGLHGEEVTVERGSPLDSLVWTTGAAGPLSPLERLPLREASLSLWDRAANRPTAGTLRILGPEVLAPLEVGPEGSWTGPLRLGLWEVLGSAKGLGLGSEDLRVAAEGPPPTVRVSLGSEVVTLQDGVLTITDTVSFKVGSAELEASSRPLLSAVARALQTRPEILQVQIEGHTDAVGDPDRNRQLSEARAEAVRDALLAQGVARRRLLAKGFGDSVPVASNDTRQGRADNRRVVFRVLETRTRGGEPDEDGVSPEPPSNTNAAGGVTGE